MCDELARATGVPWSKEGEYFQSEQINENVNRFVIDNFGVKNWIYLKLKDNRLFIGLGHINNLDLDSHFNNDLIPFTFMELSNVIYSGIFNGFAYYTPDVADGHVVYTIAHPRGVGNVFKMFPNRMSSLLTFSEKQIMIPFTEVWKFSNYLTEIFPFVYPTSKPSNQKLARFLNIEFKQRDIEEQWCGDYVEFPYRKNSTPRDLDIINDIFNKLGIPQPDRPIIKRNAVFGTFEITNPRIVYKALRDYFTTVPIQMASQELQRVLPSDLKNIVLDFLKY